MGDEVQAESCARKGMDKNIKKIIIGCIVLTLEGDGSDDRIERVVKIVLGIISWMEATV